MVVVFYIHRLWSSSVLAKKKKIGAKKIIMLRHRSRSVTLFDDLI